MPYARVVYLEPIDGVFDYGIPDEMIGLVQERCRVLVPRRSRLETAFVLEVTATTDVDLSKLKPVEDILDDEPMLPPKLLELARWIASYYIAPLGLVLRGMYPPGVQIRSKVVVTLQPDLLPPPQERAEMHAVQQAILDHLERIREVTVAWLGRNIDAPNLYYHLKRLEARGIIALEVVTGNPDVQPRLLKAARVTPGMSLRELVEQLPRPTPQQEAALEILHRSGDWEFIVDLEERLPGIGGRLKTLEKHGVVTTAFREVHRNPFATASAPYPEPERLTDDQEAILESLRPDIDAGVAAVHLIHGVTGSGKTEIYLQALKGVLAKGRQALMLVPEISLTPQVVARFRGRFGEDVAVLHSALSPGERFDEHRRVLRGTARIAIGARSAVFAPFDRLGLIIVDEEQDTSYKQDGTPCYNGRDVAIVRGKMEGVPVVLGSATPSLESYHNAREGKYRFHRLTRRVMSYPLPPVEIVDLGQAYEDGEVRLGLAAPAYRAIWDALDRGEQSLIYLNRRGYETAVICGRCGTVLECPHCAVAMTFHKHGVEIRCHYCGHSEDPPQECPGCGSDEITYRGTGTQKLEESIATLFPDARIARMDSDALSRKGAHEKLLREIEDHRYDIIVGTRMLTKGHDFPKVTVVVIASVDAMIHRPDFRASEHAFQEIEQVAGRAGRKGLPARVFLQTFVPEHSLLKMAQEHDFVGFAERELDVRKALGYPPFSRVSAFEIRDKDEYRGLEYAQRLQRFLSERFPEVVFRGPAPCLIPRIKDTWRYQILAHHESPRALRDVVLLTQEYARLNQMEVSTDIDPLSFF